jgi:hypothetical protein
VDGKHIVWLWTDLTEPITEPGDTTPLWGIKTLHRLDCAAQRINILQMLLLNREGTPVDSTFERSRWTTFAEHPWGSILSLECTWLARHRPVALDDPGTRSRRWLMARVAGKAAGGTRT